MTDKSKLLWHSNAPWAGTGYGTQTALFLPRLKDDFSLTCSSFFGLEGGILPWNGIPVLPGQAQTYGNETIGEHARMVFGADVRSGLVCTLMDCWVLDPRVWGQLNTCSWVPVDHDPCPDPVRQFFDNSGAIPIAMSKFGQEMLSEFDPLYVPHGVDTSVYKPLDKKDSREQMGLDPDSFVVGMVAANKGDPSRKCFQEAFEAFAELHKRKPDTILYLHTEATGRFNGQNLPNLLEACGVPASAVFYCDQYKAVHFPFNDEAMARAYSAMDVYLTPSAGEGFGIGAIQAQACGVPVIASDFSAQPELVGSGWLVKGTRTYTPIGSWQFRPDVPDIVEALTAAYRGHGDELRAKKAVEKAKEYDADKVYREHMLPALAEVQARFDARKPAELKAAA
jgi:glycosyltransferase involved in cell wall biosynthesis